MTATSDAGVPADSHILTSDGWRALDGLGVGASLAHPDGLSSRLIGTVPMGARRTVELTLADGASFRCLMGQPLDVLLGSGRAASRHQLTAAQVQDALLRGRPVRLPRSQPIRFRSGASLPVEPYLLGTLLNDPQARPHPAGRSPLDASAHPALLADVPAQRIARRAPLRLGVVRAEQAVTSRVPRPYFRASLEDRISLLQGLMDSRGSIDRLGRVEFSTPHSALGADVLELLRGLGGRASSAVVHFSLCSTSSPTAAGRSVYRLTNVRVPDEVAPFRDADRARLVRLGRFARQWSIRDVREIGEGPALSVEVAAVDGRWIGEGYFPVGGHMLSQACAA